MSQTSGWFLHRLGEESARTYRLAFGELPRLELLPLDTDQHDRVIRKLEPLHGHKLTFVDASSLLFLERLRIREVWGTACDLAIEGAHVIPVGSE